MSFQLNERLERGGFDFGSYSGCKVMLKNNALYPWFIVVPEVEESIDSLMGLDVEQYDGVMRLVRRLGMFIEQNFGSDKVNVGCVGIVVKQLHIHVVGRSEADPAWPGVVWGHAAKEEYEEYEVREIRKLFQCQDFEL